MPYSLEVDFDVYKAIFARRTSETVTENDVLPNLLGLSATSHVSPELPKAPASTSLGDWIAKGVRFPAGTEFRTTHKGVTHTGRVQSGSLWVNGKSYDSPSAAAVAITGNPVNGWRFWECRILGKNNWQLIESLRR